VAFQEKSPELLGSQAGLGAAVAVETHGEIGEFEEQVRARGYWEQVWRRFKRDRVAIGAVGFIVLLVLLAFPGAWLAENRLGHGPHEPFIPYALDERLIPVGPMTRVVDINTGDTTLFVLGADSTLGRDAFLRLLYGARVSLLVALLSTFGVVVIGVILGSLAGFYRGWLDTIISRLSEIVMAFPLLLFIIALASTVGPRLNDFTLGIFQPGVLTLVIIFTMFGWFYPARIVRSQVLSLREKEFVEAARMIGASDWRIIRSHILPHLVAPVTVYSTLIVAQYVLAEAGLSFLGVGIDESVPSWGNMLAQGPNFYTTQPWLMVWPGVAVLLTTLAFNLLGDGLRDAFDPRATH
jgi:peptide/nickel transport system permease protein